MIGATRKSAAVRKFVRLWLKRCAWLLGGGLAVLMLFVGVMVVLAKPDITPRFAERRGTLENVEADPWEPVDAKHERRNVRLVSSSGLEVELAIKRPHDRETPGPLLVLLGGHRTGQDAVDLIPDTRNITVAAVSYPFEGNRRIKGLAVVAAVPRVQRAFADTAPAVFLATDYLIARSYVDPERVELVGVSLGACFAGVVGALDERFRRVWLLHGAGDLPELIQHNLKQRLKPAPLRNAVSHLAYRLIYGPHLRPERWLEHISPRPVVLVNGREDERLPLACIETLHASAHDPFEVIWLPGKHIKPKRTELVQELIDLVADRVTGEGPVPVEASFRSSSGDSGSGKERNE